jgi:hypothetical protein
MNHWTSLSCDFANQRNYLDELFRVYPLAPDGIRQADCDDWGVVEKAYNAKDDVALFMALLKMKVFPLKDSYVAYLRRDKAAILRNPNTVKRLCSRIYQLELKEIYRCCTSPPETNRQIGPLFRNWLRKGELGATVVTPGAFCESNGNQVVLGSDSELAALARTIGYRGTKGLDLFAFFNGRYVIGEAKFLTDFGGHQNAQFNDAIAVLNNTPSRAVGVAVLDGVVYIPGRHKWRAHLKSKSGHNIMSALVLREFLHQV